MPSPFLYPVLDAVVTVATTKSVDGLPQVAVDAALAKKFIAQDLRNPISTQWVVRPAGRRALVQHAQALCAAITAVDQSVTQHREALQNARNNRKNAANARV